MYRRIFTTIICFFIGVAAGYGEEQTPLVLKGQVLTTAGSNEAAQGQVQSPGNPNSLAPQIPTPGHPVSSEPLQARTEGGQAEYRVNWTAWQHRINDVVWNYVLTHRLIFWGMTRIGYDVSKDHHIQITSTFSPDPTGGSTKILVAAITRLDGNPILEFPTGSKQTIHHASNMSIGLPMPIFTRRYRKLYFRGRTEHVTEQW